MHNVPESVDNGSPRTTKSDYYVTVPLGLVSAPIAALRTYLLLSTYLNPAEPDKDSVWPSRKRIAERGEVSMDTIDRGVKWLAENGWIGVEERYDDAGDRTSNRYYIYGTQRMPADVRPRVTAELRGRVTAEVVEEVEPSEVAPRVAASPPRSEGRTETFALASPAARTSHRETTTRKTAVLPCPVDWTADAMPVDLYKETRAKYPDVPADAVQYEWARFINYNAAKANQYARWRAAWWNWMVKAERDHQTRGPNRVTRAPSVDFDRGRM